MGRAEIELTLAHSPDPDDVFMWWPLTGMIEPAVGAGARVVRGPALETGGFRFRAIAADIQTLNQHAASAGENELYDVSALSFYGWAMVRGRYVACRTGSSFGEGYGPKIIAGADGARRGGAALTLEDLRRGPAERIAIPGLRTTARLVFELCVGGVRRDAGLPAHELVEMGFEKVIGSVAMGECGAGIVIHQGQLQYRERGLAEVADLGAWWGKETGLALPLGANAIRRDLDVRFGEGTVARVSGLLRESVEYAWAHRDEGVAYARTFAPELSEEETRRYLDMYVTGLTRDAGEQGERAVRELLRRAAGAGLLEMGKDEGGMRMV